MEVTLEPFFLNLNSHSIFCVYYHCQEIKSNKAILYFPPFAEEMHKSRRMVSLQAREFAKLGFSVLVIDPIGCGDSSGDFEDANLALWLECGSRAHQWIQDTLGIPVFLWGLRTGALIITALATNLSNIAGLIYWQPVLNGAVFLTQFIRIKLASEMFSSGSNPANSVKSLLSTLQTGQSIEVGGYMISPELGIPIQALKLQNTPPTLPVIWLEISEGEDEPSQESLKLIAQWQNQGISISHQMVRAENFWSSTEIQESEALIRASCAQLSLQT